MGLPMLGAMAIATGNKSELAMGYCTLYGDMNGGYAPLGDLYKTEVYEVAKAINSRATVSPPITESTMTKRLQQNWHRIK